jgi:hypothetical protein
MPVMTQSTLVVAFPTRGKAEGAIDELWHAGFRQDQIGIVTPSGHVTQATTATEKSEENAGEGAVVGAATGGVVGAVLGALATGLIPGVGLVLAGGMLTGIIVGGAAGAAAGSYLGPFIALGFTEAEATRYHSELKAGKTLVTVNAADRAAEVETIVHGHGGHLLNLLAHRNA